MIVTSQPNPISALIQILFLICVVLGWVSSNLILFFEAYFSKNYKVDHIFIKKMKTFLIDTCPNTSKIDSFNGLLFKRCQERVFFAIDIVNLTCFN